MIAIFKHCDFISYLFKKTNTLENNKKATEEFSGFTFQIRTIILLSSFF